MDKNEALERENNLLKLEIEELKDEVQDLKDEIGHLKRDEDDPGNLELELYSSLMEGRDMNALSFLERRYSPRHMHELYEQGKLNTINAIQAGITRFFIETQQDMTHVEWHRPPGEWEI